MALFEIDLNDRFKINNSHIFFNEDTFHNFYKFNTLNDGYRDDISIYIDDIKIFNIYPEINLEINSNSMKKLSKIVKSSIYNLGLNEDTNLIYPEWLLFYIGIKKRYFSFLTTKEFNTFLDEFKLIAELRFKKYVIKNIREYLEINSLNKCEELKKNLNKELKIYIKENIVPKKLIKFLEYLIELHHNFEEREKYKLMWNLEAYIEETIHLLLNNNYRIEEIYNLEPKSMKPSYSYLNKIKIYKPLYVKENNYFFNCHLKDLNNIFNLEFDIDSFINLLLKNDKFEEIIFYYVELIKRYNSNKIVVGVLSALIKAIIIGLEEIIKDTTKEEKIFNALNKLSNNSTFEHLKQKLNINTNANEFYNSFQVLNLEEESEAKYLNLYYISRVYVAHKNIDMQKFFWEDDKIVVTNVMSSIFIILYKLSIYGNQ